MAEQFIQLPPNSTGTKMRTFEQTVGANVVDHQAVVICDSNGSIIGSMTSAPIGTEQGLVTRPASLPNVTVAGGAASPSFVRTSDEPRQVFYDAFDGSVVDVTNRWTSSSAGGGVAPAQTGGNLTLGTGTTAAGWSSLGSQQNFTLPIPGWMGFSSVVKVESPVTANTYRFWGAGTIPGSPTATAPLTDAVGFELYTDGKLYAVVYAAGVRTVIQDLSAATGNAKQPTDALNHRYIVYVRTDASYWYIDGLASTQLVATSSMQGPATQALPARMLAVAGTTPASSGVITSAGTAVWDTAKNSTQLSDGTYPWRKAAISSTGAILDDMQDRAGRLLGVLSTGSNVIGGVTQSGTWNIGRSDIASATTNITTQNLNPSTGAATANSTVALASLSGVATVTIQVTGTYTGVLTPQVTVDGVNWIALAATGVQNLNTNVYSATIPSAATGVWQAGVAGISGFRISANAAVTGTAVVTLRASDGAGAFALDAPIPTGANVLGIVNEQIPINQSVDGTGTAQPMQFAYFNVSTAQTGVSLITAPAAGRAIRVVSYAIAVGAAMNVSLIGATTTLLLPFAASGGISFAGTLQGPAFQLNTATALTYTTSAVGQATGHICYVVV